jgi:heme exporter protein D
VDRHDLFVLAAYGVAFLGIAGLALWVVIDGCLRRKELAALDAQGVRRRSNAR